MFLQVFTIIHKVLHKILYFFIIIIHYILYLLINIFLINITVLFLHYYKFLNHFHTSSHLIILIYKKLALHTYFRSYPQLAIIFASLFSIIFTFAISFVLAIIFVSLFFSK